MSFRILDAYGIYIYTHTYSIFSLPRRIRVFLVGRHVSKIYGISYTCKELDKKREAECNKRCSKSWIKKNIYISKKKSQKELFLPAGSDSSSGPFSSGQGWDKRKPPPCCLLCSQPSAGRATWCPLSLSLQGTAFPLPRSHLILPAPHRSSCSW